MRRVREALYVMVLAGIALTLVAIFRVVVSGGHSDVDATFAGIGLAVSAFGALFLVISGD